MEIDKLSNEQIENLIGTKWIGKFDSKKEKESILIFYPYGILKYENIGSSWEIKDGEIVLSINNGFATMHGYIENNKLKGNALNIQYQEWSFEYKLVNTEELLSFLISENAEEEINKNKIIENQIFNLGRKWSLKNHSFFKSEIHNVEILENGFLKVNNNIEAKWELINGRIIFKFHHIQAEYNGEILQNRIIGLAKNSEGREWIFFGELIPEAVKPENSRNLRIKHENRGFGLMASTDETWNNFKLLENGFYIEDEEKIILISVNGQEYVASKDEVPWEATMYNKSYEEDKKYYDIFYGRIPNGGQFLIYRAKNNPFQNEITIGVLNVKSDGITFEIL